MAASSFPCPTQVRNAPLGAGRPVRPEKIYRPGHAYKKAGVVLMGIGDAQVAQGVIAA